MNTRRRKFPIALAIIILITVIYGSVVIGNQISIRNQKLEIIAKNKETISNLKVDIDNLNEEIENSSSSDFVEKVAREELGMVKPREIVYVDKSMQSNNNDKNENDLNN